MISLTYTKLAALKLLRSVRNTEDEAVKLARAQLEALAEISEQLDKLEKALGRAQ